MGDVAAEAGISLRALYQVCPGKDELFVAVIDDAFGRLLPVLPEPGGGTVPAVIEGFCAFVAEHRDLGLLYVRAHTSAVRLTDGRDPFAAYLVELQDRLTALVAAAQADGHASRLPAALLARSVIATLIATLSDGLINDLDVGTLAPDVVAVFAPHFT
ncbi:MAG: hypothetical protein QOF76_2722 [Solirubrobacteraceae bacterium]|jgi:AcrR family transcriptional regulator|nr:hypothetical protein [Solirubrobacteraceae bacterium]